MTASRVRGSQRIRSNAERTKEKLLGTTAIVEDWHAKMTFHVANSNSMAGILCVIHLVLY